MSKVQVWVVGPGFVSTSPDRARSDNARLQVGRCSQLQTAITIGTPQRKCINLHCVKTDFIIVIHISTHYSTTFRKQCGGGECFETTTCPRTEVGGKQGHAPCKVLSLEQSLFCCVS